jgi:hypothetical protein
MVEITRLELRRSCDDPRRTENVACSLARRRPISGKQKARRRCQRGLQNLAMMSLCR